MKSSTDDVSTTMMMKTTSAAVDRPSHVSLFSKARQVPVYDVFCPIWIRVWVRVWVPTSPLYAPCDRVYDRVFVFLRSLAVPFSKMRRNRVFGPA